MVMSYIHNIGADVRPVNALVVREPHLVRDRDEDSAPIPSADLHARRIAREAEGWARFTLERARLREDAVWRKALDACAFSVRHRAHALAVPTKLVGTAKHQRALWGLVRGVIPSATPLDVEEDHGRLVASLGGERLGEVQPKHAPWLRPLVPFGARLYLLRVTGHERAGYRLGLNVAVGHVGAALDRLRHALGEGDGVAPLPIGGDGAALDVRPSLSRTPSDRPRDDDRGGDVVLWREADGSARASVPHAVRHSPTGIEWGYGGSGPADLARSVLLAFADEATAERLYQPFKAEVIARIPHEGGVLRAADVRAWLAARGVSSCPPAA